MKFYNKTRISKSIPRKLIRDRKFHLIPIYYLMLTSYLGKEGISNGGSYKFADHIYFGKPKGRYAIGYLVDFIFLRLKSAQSFKFRYLSARKEIDRFIRKINKNENIRIAAIPSGYAREIFDIATQLKIENHSKYGKIEWHLLDLDRKLLNEIKKRNELNHAINYWQGDALSNSTYHKIKKLDLVVSMGFTEFLTDSQTLKFYKMINRQLNKGGIFITSGMVAHKFSEYLLKNIAELKTSYRSREDLTRLAKKAGFKLQKIYQDKNRIQTMMILEKV
jgi:hypothetical protein